jgi:hypothetical protein
MTTWSSGTFTEVVNVLDERLHSLANGAFSLGVADTRELIAPASPGNHRPTQA